MSYKNETNNSYPNSFIPALPQPVASALSSDEYPQNTRLPKVFEPLTIRNVTFKHRLWASPMCQYSSDNGHATDWHLVHLGAMATRGVEGIIVEATAVVPEGRISPEDAGLWQDSQIAPLKRIVDFVHTQGTVIGIQLGHAGRKASTLAPWVNEVAAEAGDKTATATKENRGWPDDVVGPSAIAHAEGYPNPREASLEYIESLKKAFVDAIDRAKQCGFDFIELHGAHGYLLHSFNSPVANHRTDKYGGSLENRMRLSLELAELARKNWSGPLFYRVSATDWIEGEERSDDGSDPEGWRFWGIEQTTILAQRLRDLGVDLLDVSSGGVSPNQKITIGPGYQVPFAAHLKKHVPGLLIAAVGLITSPGQSEEILQQGQADALLFARELLRDIDFPLKAAEELGAAVQPAVQYARAWTRMVKPKAPEDARKGTSSPTHKEKLDGEYQKN